MAKSYKISQLRTQSGAALLVFLLLMVTGASYVLVSKLNANVTVYSRQVKSAMALSIAKQALISYSIAYPDNQGGAPGILPCPSLDLSGSALSNCSTAGNNLLGRFPWNTLNMGRLRDSNGDELWYVVSDNFRTPLTGQINSDTAGTLSVNGNTDIVAIIFSPGTPIGSQDRISDPLDVANYLEGGNEVSDDAFFTTSASEFNDQLVYITKDELMGLVEKRIAGDVAYWLNEYRGTESRYPWLATFGDPATLSTFHGVVATIEGQLPFHWSNDPSGVTGRNPFVTDIVIDWSTVSANITAPATTSYGFQSGYPRYAGEADTPSQECLVSTICTDGYFSDLDISAPITIPGASCTWTDRETVNCTGTYVNQVVNNYPAETVTGWAYSFNIGQNQWIFKWDSVPISAVRGSATGVTGWTNNGNNRFQYAYTETLTRTYTISIEFTDNSADGVDIVPSGPGVHRTRSLILEDDGISLFSTGPNSISVMVEDDRQVEVTEPGPVTNTYTTGTGSSTMTNDADTTGTVTVTGVQYDMDVDGYDQPGLEYDPELPEWIVENGWHELIYVAYAPGEATAPGGGTECVTSTSCITLNGSDGTTDNKRGLVLYAGQELTNPVQDRSTPPADITDFFENENTDLDAVFETNTQLNFNDRVKVLAEAP